MVGFRSWFITCFLLSFSLRSSNNITNAGDPLDVILHEHAFRALAHRRPHTGALYEATLPANLAGMEVTVVRLRSKTLWRVGTNFSSFRIPSRTLPMPRVRRLFIVYQNLGNWSSHYYNVSGYSLVSSVVGFTAYDASNMHTQNITKIDLETIEKPISIQFPSSAMPQGSIPGAKCATFTTNGEVSLSDMGIDNVCYSRSTGHFSVVAPSERKQRVLALWAIGFSVGFVLLVSLVFGGMVLVKCLKVKNIDEMEREADEGILLETIWIGNSKMPSATVIRTHPIIENASLS